MRGYSFAKGKAKCLLKVKKVTQNIYVQFSHWKDLGMCVLVHLESKPLAFHLKENPIAAHKQLIKSQTLPEKKHEDKPRVVLCLNTCSSFEYITDEAIVNASIASMEGD